MYDIVFAIVAMCIATSLAGLLFICLSPLIHALNEWLGD